MTQSAPEADRVWAALSDPTRLRLLDLLLERGEATASALATELPITRQGVTKHLLVLQRVGLVEAERSGRELRFTVRLDTLAEAQRLMLQVASRWDERLSKIKTMAEAMHKAARPVPAEH